MEENKTQTNKKGAPNTIHTYMSDMAKAVRENEMSVIKVALAEQKARERGDQYRKIEGTPMKKILFAVGGVIIILVAIATSYFLIKKAQEKNLPAVITRNVESIISQDNQVLVDMTNATNKSDVSNLINPEVIEKGIANSIKAIFLTKTQEDYSKTLFELNDLLSILKVTAPGSLIRSFTGEYMIGTYTLSSENERSHLFLILKVSDYNLAYAGMLEWEKTILDDLFTLFRVNVSGENVELFGKSFKDIVIKNKDARILYNKEGVDALFYLFPDKKHLVITDNQETIKEIVARLLLKQAKPL